MAAVRICFFGDSMVNGALDPECLGWAGRVCAAECARGHDVTYYNLGIRGDTSADVDARWLGEAQRRLPPQHDGRVVFSYGINDTVLQNGTQRVSFDDSLQITRRILSQAKSMYPALLVGPPPSADRALNREILRLSNALGAVSTEIGVPFLQVFEALAAGPSWIPHSTLTDGYHPRADGYAEFAALVENWSAWRAWFDQGGYPR